MRIRRAAKKAERPGLKKVLRILSRGDTLVVWKLDRLGRSMRHLVVLVEELRDRGINFRSLTDSIDTSTPMGRFFFHVMGALAEMERELIVERTRAGLDAARAEGRIHRHLQPASNISRTTRMREGPIAGLNFYSGFCGHSGFAVSTRLTITL